MSGVGDRVQIRMEQWTTSKVNGNNVESITNTFDTWANVRRKGGDRSSLNGKTGLTNSYEFEIDYASVQPIDITGNWRIIYDRRYFKVHSIEKKKQERFYYIINAESKGAR